MKHNQAIKAALQVMQDHIAALNQRDEAKIAATLHFPHFRLSNVTLMTWETQETYFADFKKRAGSSWAKSGFDDIQILGTSDTKVHLDVRVSRHDWDQNLLTQFRSAWVITKENDRWAAKFRSSFADQ
jgi:hypothetical protein